jgi:hypothetical protein
MYGALEERYELPRVSARPGGYRHCYGLKVYIRLRKQRLSTVYSNIFNTISLKPNLVLYTNVGLS